MELRLSSLPLMLCGVVQSTSREYFIVIEPWVPFPFEISAPLAVRASTLVRREELRYFTTQVIHGKWFGKNGVYGFVEADQLFKIRGDHQNRHGRNHAFDTPGDFATIHPRHEEIHYHQ